MKVEPGGSWTGLGGAEAFRAYVYALRDGHVWPPEEQHIIETRLDPGDKELAEQLCKRPVHFARNGDVLTADPDGASLRIEIEGAELAGCVIQFDGEVPLHLGVHPPTNGDEDTLITTAVRVVAAIYWSRMRRINGGPAGDCTITRKVR